MAELVQACRQSLNLTAELAWDQSSLKQAMMGPFWEAFGATQEEGEGKLSGFILGQKLSLESGGKSGAGFGFEIWCLATHPQHQRKGLMSFLLSELQKRFVEIWLEVHESNIQAIRFYKHKEFQQVGSRPKYYKDGKDALLFTWKSASKK